MSLQSWLENRWIKKEATTRSEVTALIEKSNRDLAESQNAQITPDWRLAIAYSASLGYATAALRAVGFRVPQSEGHHFRTFESLRYTIGAEEDLIITLQAIRKKRHMVSYDASGIVSETEIGEAIEIAGELHDKVLHWLRERHPELVTD